MKHLLEIECPEGYKPIYDAKSGKIKITKEYDYKNIKTFEDACKYLHTEFESTENKHADACKYLHTEFESTENKHADAIIKIDIIGKALNNNYQFEFNKENIYYPYIWIYSIKPKRDYIKVFIDKSYFLVGGYAVSGSYEGFGYLPASFSSICASACCGLFPCKSKEIALHFSKYFVKEIFDAIYAGQLNYEYV